MTPADLRDVLVPRFVVFAQRRTCSKAKRSTKLSDRGVVVAVQWLINTIQIGPEGTRDGLRIIKDAVEAAERAIGSEPTSHYERLEQACASLLGRLERGDLTPENAPAEMRRLMHELSPYRLIAPR